MKCQNEFSEGYTKFTKETKRNLKELAVVISRVSQAEEKAIVTVNRNKQGHHDMNSQKALLKKTWKSSLVLSSKSV